MTWLADREDMELKAAARVRHGLPPVPGRWKKLGWDLPEQPKPVPRKSYDITPFGGNPLSFDRRNPFSFDEVQLQPLMDPFGG